MSGNSARSLEEAIAWHLKVPTMRDEEWPEFVAWLESSTDNRAENDRLAATDFLVGQAELGDLEPVHALTDRTGWQSWKRLVPIGIAASLALILGTWTWLPSNAEVRAEETRPGDTRELARAEGVVIALNGDSRIIVDDANPRTAVLERGEALFTVRHSDKPFELTAGGIRIRDLGTVFNVRLERGRLHVAVREGAVLLDPGGANLRINAGQSVSYNPSSNFAIQSPGRQVGGWVDGNFAFEDAKVQDVADALHRRNGIEVRLSRSLSNAPFTGNIRLSGDEAADVAHLATLLGADYRREGKVWQLSEHNARR